MVGAAAFRPRLPRGRPAPVLGPRSVTTTWQRHAHDRSDYPECHASYGALLQACEEASWATPSAMMRFESVEAAAQGFARCARAERLRPTVVLEQLREAVRPLGERYGIDVGEITRLAAWAYYERD